MTKAVDKFAHAGIDKRARHALWGHVHAGRMDGGRGWTETVKCSRLEGGFQF